MQIEHNPYEKRPTNGIWWISWALVAFGWSTYLYFNVPDWGSIALGAYSMAILVFFVTEKIGNRVPPSLGGRE